ncbi:MAG: GNAT family N-acetyltransferase [Flavobacteriaceae bacterium]|jgi:RimJ/RimL family protein N-acetyltransferase|nr:GNAT family N-acetyltransferase [Flavobacteriaceae bacterium]
MKVILETERLLLRELHPFDAKNFYELNLNPDVIKYTGDKVFGSVEESEYFLKNYKDYKINGYGRWAVIEKKSDEFLGWCGLKYHNDSDEIDIGFRFFEKYWNNGFATESAKACIVYGFKNLQLESIIGRAMKENTASVKVLEKIGLEFEKEFDFENKEGVIYRIRKDEQDKSDIS